MENLCIIDPPSSFMAMRNSFFNTLLSSNSRTIQLTISLNFFQRKKLLGSRVKLEGSNFEVLKHLDLLGRKNIERLQIRCKEKKAFRSYSAS